VPQLRVEVDREKALSLGVPVQDIFDALQSTMAALYVNDFNKFGRTYRVQIQADAPFRSQPEDLGAVYVRSAMTREMIPLKSLIQTSNVVGPEQLERFNGFLAARVLGNGKPGVSSGEAIRAVEEVAARALPEGYTIAWSGQAYQEKRTGRQSAIAFSLAIVMVFLILAALYERWLLPFAVVMAVPFAVAGALTLVFLRGLENDIYFQIGLGGADRPRRQERDPDRRVRPAGLSRGQERRRSRAQRGAAALPAHRDDLARVRARRDAAHDRDRRGRRRAPLHGHRRGGRDARRHLRRDDLRAAVFRRRRAPQEAARDRAMKRRAKNQGRTTFFVALAFLLTSCTTVGPDYQRPVMEVPNEYPVPAESAEALPVAEGWWSLYSDATLDELIAAARTSNADMRLAIARVSEAAGLLREANAAYYPEVTGSASATRTGVSNVVIPPPQPGIPVSRNQYQISASTSFELDFWGKFARASEAARANFAATQFSRDVVELTLAGGTAQAYFALRSLDAQILVLDTSILSRRDSLEIAKARLDSGSPPSSTCTRRRAPSPTPWCRGATPSARARSPRGCSRC
jgi:hypothetical protein